jgi:hypothetical protein
METRSRPRFSNRMLQLVPPFHQLIANEPVDNARHG